MPLRTARSSSSGSSAMLIDASPTHLRRGGMAAREGAEELGRVLPVDEEVVVDEEERAAIQPRDLLDDVGHRPAAVLRVHRRDRAEAAPVRTPPGGLQQVVREILSSIEEVAVDVGV